MEERSEEVNGPMPEGARHGDQMRPGSVLQPVEELAAHLHGPVPRVSWRLTHPVDARHDVIPDPLPCLSGEIDGPVPSTRERLLDPLNGGGPAGVPQPFPTGAQNVDCPIPCVQLPITQVAD